MPASVRKPAPMPSLSHETLFILAALLLMTAGLISTTPTVPAVLLACAGAWMTVLGLRAEKRELAA